MHATGEIRWCGSLADDPRSGTAAWIATLAAGEAQFGVDLAPNALDLEAYGQRRSVDAERFLRRRLTFRHLVARWCGRPAASVVIGYGPSGRPDVREPRDGPFCSLSARGDVAAFALSEDPVGIDLEPIAPGAIAWSVLAASEQAELALLTEPARSAAFLELWTIKEAYLKAEGSGLLRDPAAVAISRRDHVLEDERTTYRLDPSTLHRVLCGTQPITAACVSLPGR